MNKIHSLLFLLATVFFLSCSNDNNTTTAAATTSETSNEPKQTTSSETTQGDGIVGDWEMEGSVLDTNDNLQIDEEERKNLKPASFKDYMKLNSDGSGLFTVAKMEGNYEINDEGSGKKIRWLDKANGQHRIGTIIKITKDELHIKEPGGSGLFIWKRI
jgi:hypothetical protein